MRLRTAIPERELTPPEPSPSELDHAERDAEHRMYLYAAAMAESLAGRGPLWPTGVWTAISVSPEFDNEQAYAGWFAIRDAIRDAALSDAQRWQRVMGAVCVEAAKYAEYTAERT